MPDDSAGGARRDVLIVALSGRALAAAARRCGYRPLVLDLFHDRDTEALAGLSRGIPGSLAGGFKAAALLAAAAELAPQGMAIPVVYGSGFEGRPRLLSRLARGRVLCGNRPAVVTGLKDPRQFFPLLDRLAIAHPRVCFAPPPLAAGWLVKRIGASGGGHINPMATAPATRRRHYFQRYLEGRAVSALFLADGKQARVIGWSEQWPAGGQGEAFLFGGAMRPARLSARLKRRLAGKLADLVRASGLVGLNAADFILAGEDYGLLEINPRPGASLDISEGRGASRLFEAHLAACAGRLPDAWEGEPQAAAMQVVYAPRRLSVPPGMVWPDWAADLPRDGTTIPRGAPFCTLLAKATMAAMARRLLVQRERRLWVELGRSTEIRPAIGDEAVAVARSMG